MYKNAEIIMKFDLLICFENGLPQMSTFELPISGSVIRKFAG